jgi:hypothetical protein
MCGSGGMRSNGCSKWLDALSFLYIGEGRSLAYLHLRNSVLSHPESFFESPMRVIVKQEGVYLGVYE